MKKRGAIILGTGGDMSNSAMGKFYEGIMVTGATTDATDDAVQANIVAVARYKNFPTPAPTPPPAATALGCFRDGGKGKPYDLPVSASKSMTTDDPVLECGVLCAGYAYFALEYGKECRCGNAYGQYGKSADPGKDCNMKCAKNDQVMCGGFFTENVYRH